MPQPLEGAVQGPIPQDLRMLVRQEVRRENERLATHVALREDEPTFYQLEQEASQLPEGSRRRGIIRRLRSLEPPTQGQIVRRRIAGWGLVTLITAFTIQQGLETQTALQTSQDAITHLGPNIGTALSHVHVDLLNLGQTFRDAGHAVDTVVTSTVNTAGNVVDHAVKTAEGIGADVLTLIARPWRRPRKRGRIPV